MLKRMLNGFWTRGGMTLIVLATKSKAEDALNRINPNKAAEVANVYGAGTVQLDGGIEDEGRKMRNSFHWIVRAILMAKGALSQFMSWWRSCQRSHRRDVAFGSQLETWHLAQHGIFLRARFPAKATCNRVVTDATLATEPDITSRQSDQGRSRSSHGSRSSFLPLSIAFYQVCRASPSRDAPAQVDQVRFLDRCDRSVCLDRGSRTAATLAAVSLPILIAKTRD